MHTSAKIFKHCCGVAALIPLLLSSFLRASDYDAGSGIIDVSCLQGVVNGQRLNKIREVQLRYEGDTLTVLTLSKTVTSGPCEATLDLLSLVYHDVVPIDGEDIELTAALGNGLTLDVTDRKTRQDLITEDVTVGELGRREIKLPGDIDAQMLEIRQESGDDAPGFIRVFEGNLVVEPELGDAGVYPLRLEWGDQVELLEVTVTENPGSGVDTATQPESLPTFSSLNLFSAESPFNTLVSDSPGIDPNSEVLVESIRDSMNLSVVVGQYSTPVYFSDSATPRSSVELACGEPWGIGLTAMTGIPIPGWAIPAEDSDGEDVPVGCGEESGSDNFMVILDLENRCEYDFWQARQENGEWVASYGVGMSMDGTGVSSTGMSARGSGFAFLGGVIWPDELENGHINHVLAFSYDFTKAGGPVAPATDSDGITESDKALPEGALVQLDPDLDLDTLDLEPYERTIARAMQEYGMLLVDTGGSGGPVGFYAIDPDSVTAPVYTDIWGEEDFIVLENLDVTSLPLRVLALGEQDGDWQDSLAPFTASSCNAYQ